MKKLLFFVSLVWSFIPYTVHAQDDWSQYYHRGLEFYNNGDFRSAVEELNLAIQANPSYTRAYALRGKIKVLLFQNESATLDYQKAFELNAEYFHSNEGKMPLKSLLEDYKDVIYRYSYGVYTKSSKDSSVRFTDQLSNTDEKIVFLEQIHKKIIAGQEIGVKRDLLSFIQQDTANTYAYYLLGCLSDREGDYKSAVLYYTKNTMLDTLFYLHYYKRALSFFKLEHYDSAQFDLDKVVQLNPEFDLLYYNRAVIHKKLKHWHFALSDLNRALLLNQDLKEAYFNRAFVKKELLDYKGALEDYSTYITMHSEDAMAYNNRANLFMLLGDYSSAQKDYDRALALSPQLSMAYLNRGISNLMLGSKDQACHDFSISSMMGNAKAKKKMQLYCH